MNINKVKKTPVRIRSAKGKKHNNHSLLKAAEIKGTQTAAQQIDGGEEVHQAVTLIYEGLRPVTAVAYKGKELFKKSVLERKRKKYKIVTPATNAGNKKADDNGMKQTVKKRKIKVFLNKIKKENVKTGSVAKLVRKLLGGKAKFYIGKISLAMMGVLGSILSLTTLVVMPIVLIVVMLYNSPVALFLPQLTADETVQVVTEEYVSEFLAEVEILADTHAGYDEGEIYYQDAAGNIISPMPHQDIMCVYMVEYGMGSTAVIMTDSAKKNLKSVIEDMCIYSTEERTEKRTDNKGKEYEVDILEVHVVLKDYKDMAEEYRFSQEQIKMIEEMRKYIAGRA